MQGVGVERVGVDAFDAVPAASTQRVDPACRCPDLEAFGGQSRRQVSADVSACAENQDPGHGLNVCLRRRRRALLLLRRRRAFQSVENLPLNPELAQVLLDGRLMHRGDDFSSTIEPTGSEANCPGRVGSALLFFDQLMKLFGVGQLAFLLEDRGPEFPISFLQPDSVAGEVGNVLSDAECAGEDPNDQRQRGANQNGECCVPTCPLTCPSPTGSRAVGPRPARQA